MDVLGSTGWVELNLFRTQMDEERQVRALASGLRVVSASDDPSGLAIAENIQTKVAGLQQGVQNIQTASNLLNVADSTLANVQSILSRIHSLIVEAASDLNSASQLQSIQTEIDSLLTEINKISSGASFNGIKLLDGSLATSNTLGIVSAPYALQVNPFDSGTGPNVYDATGSGVANSGPLLSAPTNGNPMYGGNTAGFVSGLIEYQIVGYSTNPVDPNLGALGQPGVYVKITQYSTDPTFGGTGGATEQISTSALPTDAGVIQQSVSNANSLLNMLVFNLANLSPQDVGVTQAFETFDATPASATSGHALQINESGTEGGIVQISLPSVSTSALGISSISVLDPNSVDWQNNPSGTVSNIAATQDAEARVQNAMDLIGQARAQVGAQGASLQGDSNDASLEAVNQIASESAIRDVDIGQAATNFTKDQVMSQIGTSVLAQMQTNAQLVIQLVNGLNPGVAGKV
jgi:flagellin-like hook-associated protein FlgL